MMDVSTIRVDPDPNPSTFRLAIRHTMIWGYLIGAEASSHLLFGGSWVIDVMVLTSTIMWIVGKAFKESGSTVAMSPAEIRRWVTAGMPRDIKHWRELQKISGAA